jgi:hypothetical protein
VPSSALVERKRAAKERFDPKIAITPDLHLKLNGYAGSANSLAKGLELR